jgi:hypothetical protein
MGAERSRSIDVGRTHCVDTAMCIHRTVWSPVSLHVDFYPYPGLRIVHRLSLKTVMRSGRIQISVCVRTTVKYAPLLCVELCVFLSPPNIDIEIFMSSTNIPAPPPDTHSPLFTPGPVAARCPRLQPFWDRA